MYVILAKGQYHAYAMITLGLIGGIAMKQEFFWIKLLDIHIKTKENIEKMGP